MSSAGSVLLIDDHTLVRHGLQMLIQEAMPSLAVAVAASLAEGIQVIRQSGRLDLVLLDLTLGDVHGMAGLRQLRADHPYVPVVVLSAQDDRAIVLLALDNGAMGFISKSATPTELRQALRDVLVDRRIHLPQSLSHGEAGVQAAPAREGRPLADLASLGLTERQIQVVGLVVQGLRNKEIARRLDISEVMVKKHITPALQALGVADRTKLLVNLSLHGYRVPSVRDIGTPGA